MGAHPEAELRSPAVPGPDPTARRRRIALLVAPAALALGVVAGTGVSGAQIPPLFTTTTEPPPETTTTTEPPPETTTTEPPAATTTTQRSTPTTARATTTTTAVEDDDVAVDDDVVTGDGDAEETDEGSEVTEPAPTSSTLRDLLVPGDGSDGAQSTTTTSTTVAEGDEDGVDEETQVWLIVAGLVAVALLIGAWTVRYWRRTQPDRPDDPGPEPDQTTVFGTP